MSLDTNSTQQFVTPEITKTACPYCGVGCGVLAEHGSDSTIKIKGDPDHPANRGRLCSKGSDLAETLDYDGRLLSPFVDGKESTWDNALNTVSNALSKTIEEHGPESVAFYVSGQLLTEDYYVVNKFVKGYLGTANIDTNSRLCMASSVAGHKRAFGSDTVPGCYQDLEEADLVILTGSNMAWCHPVLFQRITAAREKNKHLKIIAIDPRRTATAELADIHLAINPGSDSVLFAGLLTFIANNNGLQSDYIEAYTEGFSKALENAEACSLGYVAEKTGLSLTTVETFYRSFLNTEKTVTVYSQGINQSENGSDSVNSIINCHLATGRIGRPGMGPFSVTGQPNAMGGREVGGLANMLAAHMDIENSEHRRYVQDFWASPKIPDKPGLKAVDLFNNIASGKIKFVWIMATNPVDSLPMANVVREALNDCAFVVVSDVSENTDTLPYARVRLPSAAWSEKSGTVTNSERCISRQRPLRKTPDNCRPDWWQICEVAKRLGFTDAFNFNEPYEIFREHAALSAYKNNGSRDFDIGAYQNIDKKRFDSLTPFYWPSAATPRTEEVRFFAKGQFFTPAKRARFIPVEPQRITRTTDAYPLTLNTGRIRDQWHTMTRTGNSSRLNSHLAEPYVELNPTDAETFGIDHADLVTVSSQNSSIIVRALISFRQKKGSAFVPIHWSDQFASNARVDTLVSPHVDPTSGQPASKSEPVHVARVDAACFGFCISRSKTVLSSDALYWANAPCEGGWRQEFASAADLDKEVHYWKFKLNAAKYDLVESFDAAKGIYNLAFFKGDQLEALVFLATTPVKASRSWASQRLVQSYESKERTHLLAGMNASNQPDIGSIVCSCFMVGKNQIQHAIQKQGCLSVNAVCDETNAGSNCGSCRSEISQLLKSSIAVEEIA